MPSPDSDDFRTQTASWSREQVVSRFQLAWQRPEPPCVREFVDTFPGLDLAVLADLIRFDLAQQVERGNSPRIEDYLRQFPELTSHEKLVADLIEAEYRLVSQRDPSVTFASYFQRFPKYQSELATRQLHSKTADTADIGARQEQTASWGSGQSGSDRVAPGAPPAPPLPESLGRFEIRRWLGAGAFGDVYEAFDPQLDRAVAIKVAKQIYGLAEQQIARFQREAKAAAGLRHPHIVPVYEFGRHEDQFYIASAFIRGQTLRDRIRSVGPFEISEAVRIVRQLAEALAYSHEQGIVHRDLKPANVMLDENNSPMLMDFGLASRLNQEDELTLTGQQLGTPMYMSPEQARGKEGAAIAASDQYSLGMMLYELITGKTPFTGTVEMLMYHQQATEPPSPRSSNQAISRDLETVCLKCLQKDPAKRYATTRELVDDLRRLEAGDPIRARREGLFSKALRRVRRNPLTTASLAVVCLLLMASVWIWSVSRDQRATALADRQLTDVKSRLERLIGNVELTPDYLNDADRVVAELAAFPQQSPAEAQARIQSAFADKVRSRFRDRLRSDDIPAIEQAIAALEARDADLAQVVRSEFQYRQGTWQTLFTLQPPFTNLDQLFDAKEFQVVRVDNDPRLKSILTDQQRSYRDVNSKIPSLAQMKLVCVFDSTWSQTAGPIQVKLKRDANQGYHFLVKPVEPSSAAVIKDTSEGATDTSAETTFAEGAQRGGLVQLAIFRWHWEISEVVALRELTAEELLASCPADGSLRFEVKREGSRMALTVNNLDPIEFEDMLPLVPQADARVRLTLPKGIQLQSLIAYDRALPIVASELEQADDAYHRRQFEAAKQTYERVSRETQREDLRHECQYKLGLCDEAQGDQAGAIEQFTFLAEQISPEEAEESARWSILANAQLLRIHLREKTPAGIRKVNEALDRLNLLRGKHRQQIPRVISAADRSSIVFEAGGVGGIAQVMRSPERLLADSERVASIVDLLAADPRKREDVKLLQIRANRLAGRPREAQLLASMWLKSLENCRADANFGKTILGEYVWLVIEQDASPAALNEALKDLDSYLFSQGRTIRVEAKRSARALLIERARLLIALDRWRDAEAHLTRYLDETDQQLPGERYPYYFDYAEACLLLGYLKEHNGRPDEAQEIWRKAVWRDASRKFFGIDEFPTNAFVISVILSSLTGDSGDLDPQQTLIGRFSGGASGFGESSGGKNILASQLLQLVDIDSAFVQRALGTPHGRQWCRRIAFLDLSFEEHSRAPLKLCAIEYTRAKAFAGNLSDEEELLIWNFMDAVINHYQSQQLTEAQLLLCASIWKGTNVPGIFGWAQAELTLPEALRPQFAYLFGHRYQMLKRTSEAETFLQYALTKSPPDSSLQEHARLSLEKLAEKLNKGQAKQ